mgnify:CR=1 FL=1
MEKTFKDVMNTIKEGETWINKCKDRRLAKIQKSYNSIVFEFDNEYTNVGVNLNDIFVLDKKKYTFEEAMKALKEGKEIESCYSKTKYAMSPKGIQPVLYFDTAYEDWQTSIYMFSHNEIFGDWYINN